LPKGDIYISSFPMYSLFFRGFYHRILKFEIFYLNHEIIYSFYLGGKPLIIYILEYILLKLRGISLEFLDNSCGSDWIS